LAPTHSGPIVMLNLLRYREKAQYKNSDFDSNCSGAEAYQRYGAAVFPLMQKVGATVVYRGKAKNIFIGPENEEWDEVLLVKYPSFQAFLKMTTDPKYLTIVVHREAALADSRLIMTEQSKL